MLRFIFSVGLFFTVFFASLFFFSAWSCDGGWASFFVELKNPDNRFLGAFMATSLSFVILLGGNGYVYMGRWR